MAKDAPVTRTALITWILASVLMLWIVAGVTGAQWRMSPTFDEQNHVTRGIAILRTGDFRLCFHHPPLANILEGLPVAWRPHGFSPELTAWQEAQNPAMIWPASYLTIWRDHPEAGVQLIHLARLPVLLFTLLLALVIFLWSRELFGPWGGLLSLTLFALDPTVLAHGGLATTDMAAAATIVLAVYLLRRYLFAPSRKRLTAAGIAVGLALATKFSALILLPILALLLLVFVWRAPRLPSALPAQWAGLPFRQRFLQAAGHGLLVLLLAGVTVWATYGFTVEAFGSKPGEALAANASLKERIPVPAFQYLRGLKAVKTEAKGHPAYLFGRTDTTGKGWWYYFPVTVAVKTPIPALLLMLGMLVLLAIPRARAHLAPRRELLFLLLPAGIYALAALGLLGISLNLGIRHILPMYPFLFILAGGWARLRAPVRLLAPALGLLLVAQGISIARAYPDYLAYFNEAADGPWGRHRILIDSNVDWGQDLAQLAALQRERQLTPLAFSYFGSTPPEAYRIQCTHLAGKGIMSGAPAPDLQHYQGYLAISVTNLMGGEGFSKTDYRALLQRTPDAMAGKTIVIYRFP